MKKLVITGIIAAGLVSLSACSTATGPSNQNETSVTNGTVQTVPFPDAPVTPTQPTPVPNGAGVPTAPETPP
jgi:PBP1b-binding outer membrane lipoprotein LpoB